MNLQGKRKIIYFTPDAQKDLQKIMKIAPREVNNSIAVRLGLKLYLKQLQNQNKKNIK